MKFKVQNSKFKNVAYIKLIDERAAEGKLAEIYGAARKRAGRVYNILKIQSQNAGALQAMMGLYESTVKGESPLSRAQREMLAVVVSHANHCHY
jgi:alkylhydroperoxidase family enzyme